MLHLILPAALAFVDDRRLTPQQRQVALLSLRRLLLRVPLRLHAASAIPRLVHIVATTSDISSASAALLCVCELLLQQPSYDLHMPLLRR